MAAYRRTVAIALGLSLLAVPALAAELGDAAPALKIKEWVRGSPVDLEKGKGKHVYVVEFWATWCPPCRASIPHLTEMQKKFKKQGVVFIGISDENVGKVKPFVKQQGDKMAYTVAVDDGRSTNKAYMRAFGIGGIPHAFIVDKAGVIAWHGHPMSGLESALEKILAGEWDIQAAQRADKVRRLIPKYYEMASKGKKTKKLRKTGKKILKYGRQDATMMNEFAWTILTHPRIAYRDVKLAKKAAKAAYDASEGRDPAIIDTYARALFDSGDVRGAVEYQKKAIEICKDPKMMGDLKKTLARYRAELPKDA